MIMAIPSDLPRLAGSASASAIPLSSSDQAMSKWIRQNIALETFDGVSVTGVKIIAQQLKDSSINCGIDPKDKAALWESRVIFLRDVMMDITKNCPKDEKLVVISLGSCFLLMEYILGKYLIEHGYREVSFVCVDLAYLFGTPDHLKKIRQSMNEFKTRLGEDYTKQYREPLPSDRVRFIHTAEDVENNFPQQANVLVMESLPAQHKFVSEIERLTKEKVDRKNLLGDAIVVPEGFANAVTFICPSMGHNIEKGERLPFMKTQDPVTKKWGFIDYGVKIGRDGTFILNFLGEKYLEKLLDAPSKNPLTDILAQILSKSKPMGGEAMAMLSQDDVQKMMAPLSQKEHSIPKLRDELNGTLKAEIEALKKGDLERKITRQEITTLLQKVQEIAKKHLPSFESVPLGDYETSRADMLAFLSTNASHHYRKVFTLAAHPVHGCAIQTEEIR